VTDLDYIEKTFTIVKDKMRIRSRAEVLTQLYYRLDLFFQRNEDFSVRASLEMPSDVIG